MVNGDTCLTANIIQLCCQWLFICNACMMSQSPSLVIEGTTWKILHDLCPPVSQGCTLKLYESYGDNCMRQ